MKAGFYAITDPAPCDEQFFAGGKVKTHEEWCLAEAKRINSGYGTALVEYTEKRGAKFCQVIRRRDECRINACRSIVSPMNERKRARNAPLERSARSDDTLRGVVVP